MIEQTGILVDNLVYEGVAFKFKRTGLCFKELTLCFIIFVEEGVGILWLSGYTRGVSMPKWH